MGHGGDAMARQVYGRLGTVRHRSAVVEYLSGPGFVTEIVTGETPQIA